MTLPHPQTLPRRLVAGASWQTAGTGANDTSGASGCCPRIWACRSRSHSGHSPSAAGRRHRPRTCGSAGGLCKVAALGTLEAEVGEAEVVAGFWNAAGQPFWSRSLPCGGYAYQQGEPQLGEGVVDIADGGDVAGDGQDVVGSAAGCTATGA